MLSFDEAESLATDKRLSSELESGAPKPKQSDLKRFCVFDVETFLQMEIKPQEFLLSPWLPSPGVAMVFAPRGVGKTYFCLNVAYAVASGGSFLKWEADEPKSVLYLDGEMSAAVMQRRLAEIVRASDQPLQKPLRILNPEFQDFTRGLLDLSRHEDQQALEPYLEGTDLIIADNLSTLCRTGRENEGESWTIIQDWTIVQRAKGRSVLFVHHAGKGGQQRGTSRREDILDIVVNLRHPCDYSPENGCEFEVHFTKPRLVFGDDAKSLAVRLTTQEDGAQVWAWQDIDDSNLDKVKDLLHDNVSQKDIAEELGLSKGYVSKLIKRVKGG